MLLDLAQFSLKHSLRELTWTHVCDHYWRDHVHGMLLDIPTRAHSRSSINTTDWSNRQTGLTIQIIQGVYFFAKGLKSYIVIRGNETSQPSDSNNGLCQSVTSLTSCNCIIFSLQLLSEKFIHNYLLIIIRWEKKHVLLVFLYYYVLFCFK